MDKSSEECDGNRALPPAIFMTDDLVKKKLALALAYQARVHKRNHKFQDTWVIKCKTML